MATKRRYELTDEQWKLIEPLLPKQKPGGRWNDHRTTLDGAGVMRALGDAGCDPAAERPASSIRSSSKWHAASVTSLV